MEAMGWAVVYRSARDRRIGVSTRAERRDLALEVARTLMGAGHEVHWIVGPDGQEIAPAELADLFEIPNSH
jgi:hypothetical protein